MTAQIFGLDIGTSSIKIAEVKGNKSSRTLVALGSVATTGRGTLSEAESDQHELAQAVRTLVQEAKISTPFVVTSLPESQIFTRVIEMSSLTDSELSSAIKYEAEQYIPLPLTEVKLDYEVLSRPDAGNPDKKMEVLLVAAPNVLINRYLKIIDMAGLKPHALETEITASSRALITASQFSPTTLILEIGATTTELSVIASKKIVFTRSIATGGLAFTRAVAQDLGFETDQAEEYKKTYGLDASQLEGKISTSIKPIFDVVTAEVRRALAYWAGRRADDNIKRIIVTGGSAKMPGLVPYLTDATGLEAELGNPWEGLSWSPTLSSEFREEGPKFAIAVGLAQKEIFNES